MTWRAIRVSAGPCLEASRIVGHINKMMTAWHAENKSEDRMPNLGLVLDSLQAVVSAEMNVTFSARLAGPT